MPHYKDKYFIFSLSENLYFRHTHTHAWPEVRGETIRVEETKTGVREAAKNNGGGECGQRTQYT